MDFTYRSPLQDEYWEAYNQKERGSWATPSRPRHLSHQRDVKPYDRPGLSNQVRQPTSYDRPGSSNQVRPPTYSDRYKIPSYPKELNEMFGALECKLCVVEVTSPIMAKMHYSGKQHAKKIKNYLKEWSSKTGNEIDNFQQPVNSSSASGFPDYCDLCDVRLLSTNDKIAHCSGKQHKKNERDPANAKKKNKTYDEIDLSDPRFGIGKDFSSDQKKVIPAIKINNFVCELCGVKAFTQEQLNIHLGGKNHQHRLKKKESGVPKPVNPSMSILTSVVKEQPQGSVDYSMHRTPSDKPHKCDICDVGFTNPHLLKMHLEGKPHEKRMKRIEAEGNLYCEICNIEFASDHNYQGHINGKRHEKMVRQIAQRTSILKDEKPSITCKNCPYIGSLDNHLCDRSLENDTINKEKNKCESWKCGPCYDLVFDSEEEYEEHKKTRRHLLCMLNIEGDRISEDNKHWYCFTCRKQYHSHKEYCEHLFGQKHMTLTDESCDLGSKTNIFYCSVCAIIIDQQAMKEHMWSKGHLLQAAQQDITRTLTALAIKDLGTQTFLCTHCDMNFFNFIAYSDHLLAPKHLEEIVSAKLAARI